MNDTEVVRQIEHMVRFIKQEAEEKANEIAVSAEEEFNIAKLQIIEAEKQKIKKEYERRESQIEVKKKIEYSKQLNESRLKVLQAREESIGSLVHDARLALQNLTNDKGKYKQLLVDLLVQALAKLNESAVVVQAREIDLAIVKDSISSAKAKFTEKYGKLAPDVQIDGSAFLPPPPTTQTTTDDESVSCTGGIVVYSADKKIKCNNTLDERLKISYTSQLPELRELLFGKALIVRG